MGQFSKYLKWRRYDVLYCWTMFFVSDEHIHLGCAFNYLCWHLIYFLIESTNTPFITYLYLVINIFFIVFIFHQLYYYRQLWLLCKMSGVNNTTLWILYITSMWRHLNNIFWSMFHYDTILKVIKICLYLWHLLMKCWYKTFMNCFMATDSWIFG